MRWGTAIITLIALLAGTRQTPAAIVTDSPNSFLRLAASDAPRVLDPETEAFSFFMWVRRDAHDTQPMYLVDAPGSLAVYVDPDSESIVARLGNDTDNVVINLLLQDARGATPLDEWCLIAVTWNASAGILAGWAQSETVARVEGSAIDQRFVLEAPIGEMSIGAPDQADAVAQQGHYGLIVFRDHAINSVDFDTVWAARDYFAPYRLNTMADGGMLNGVDGAVWLANHAIFSNPGGAVIGDTTPALLHKPVFIDNYCIFDTSISSSTFEAAGRLSSVSIDDEAFIHETPLSLAEDAFFIRQLPTDVVIPDPPLVQHRSPRLLQLANGAPTGLIRCIVGANSRATRTTDAGDQTWPENYAHGFTEVQLGLVAGVVNRPAMRSSNRRWFGFDTLESPRLTGGVLNFAAEGGHQNFARMWSGSGNGDVGPGAGVLIPDGATFALKCAPEPGSLIIAEAPLVVRAYLLSFPGAGALTWRPEKSETQETLGSFGEATTVDLGSPDTFTHTMQPGEFSFIDKLTLLGDFGAQIKPGDACYISEGVGLHGFTIVTEVEVKEDTTVVTFERRFEEHPVLGSVLNFGAWSYVVIEYEWPALETDDEQVWRGIDLAANEGAIVNFAWDAWRPGVDGIAYGVAGWTANGYPVQIDEAFQSAMPIWMAALEADVWLQGLAENNGQPTSMSDYLAFIREGLPAAEVAWIADGVQGNGTHQVWHNYILNNARAEQVAALSLMHDEAIGKYEEHCVDAMRAGSTHWSHFGNVRLAERWLAKLPEAAMGSPDIDGDGVVDASDLITLLGSWGPCPKAPEPCPADLNVDGQVDGQDLIILLGAWG